MVFYIAKAKFLPRLQPDKHVRWDYDYIEVGDASSSSYYGYDLAAIDADLDRPYHNHNHHHSHHHHHNLHQHHQRHQYHRGGLLEGDEWAVGSSSSVAGSLSPVDESQSLWDGETLASSHSDNDAAVATADRLKR